MLDDLQGTYVDKAKLNKGAAPAKPEPARPLLPGQPAAPKGNVKDWISMVQQDIAKKKQTTK